MIPVVHPPEPMRFDADVRAPGSAFLSATPHPIGREWRHHQYWRKAHADLHGQLLGVCVYSGSFAPRGSGRASGLASSVDHYVPKSHDPTLAYEWSNFRLCRTLLNHRKGNHRDVLDPVMLRDRWFVLDLTTFRVEANPALAAPDHHAVERTIRRLELNDDDQMVAERARVIFGFAAGTLPIKDLRGKYPFIDSELTAQRFELNHKQRFDTLLSDARVRALLQLQGWV